MKNIFRRVASKISIWTGSAFVFLGAALIIVVWALTGPVFNFSDTWQLVINTGTTIITFLMVFLIQNTQNRDGKAVQLKLDELIRATKGARSHYVGLEDLMDEDLLELDKEFKLLTQQPGAVRAINKLHEKIQAEHSRRMTLTKAGSSLLNMIHHEENTSKIDSKPPANL
ncbi:MAG TPA: low affinity iron permease family protein [Candidatus Saccharibacteria bacterium]|nr:low affinity iron permease family protein [Candidatus Saccharibacteria bacterium]HRQ06910.1 low affinity iron permease family protein [Candidatus Saccharibacteria bacterium]